MQNTILSDDQYQHLTRRIVQSLELRTRIIPLNTLKHSKYKLKTPVYISLEYDEDRVIAGFSEIEAFAYADTEFEAVESLCEEIVSLYEDLEEDSKNLGPLPLKWLAYLREIIECR